MFHLGRFLVLSVALVSASASEGNVGFSRNLADFSVDLYTKANNAKPGNNVIISPLSIQTAVGLAYMGASGQTAQEMATGLRLGTNTRSSTADNFKIILDSYTNHPNVKIANKVFLQSGYRMKSEFSEIARNQFNSEAEQLDFSNSNRAASRINHWVEENTNRKIKNIIQPDAVSANTRMVLVNAIYFKGKWVKAFPIRATRPDVFWISASQSTEVDMMEVTTYFNYGSLPNLNAHAVELPYNGTDVSMVIVLPTEKMGLAALVENLQTVDLINEFGSLRRNRVNVKIPKFKAEFSLSVKTALQNMNIRKMFSSEAEFHNLLEGSEAIAVDDVLHKAFIEVDESGTEAAASTAVIFGRRSGARELDHPHQFIADHPFLYFIKDGQGNILFMGSFIKK